MPQRLKDMVRKTVSSSAHSVSMSKSWKAPGTEEDTMELTSAAGPDGDGDDSAYRGPSRLGNKSGAFDYKSSAETQVEGMKSADIMGGKAWGRMREDAWGTNAIRVTTQITMERHPSVKGKN
jgi:hypothetical protein